MNPCIKAKLNRNGNIKLGNAIATFSKLYSDMEFVTDYGTVKLGEYWLENYDAYGIDLAWTCELIPSVADYYDFDLFPRWWETC